MAGLVLVTVLASSVMFAVTVQCPDDLTSLLQVGPRANLENQVEEAAIARARDRQLEDRRNRLHGDTTQLMPRFSSGVADSRKGKGSSVKGNKGMERILAFRSFLFDKRLQVRTVSNASAYELHRGATSIKQQTKALRSAMHEAANVGEVASRVKAGGPGDAALDNEIVEAAGAVWSDAAEAWGTDQRDWATFMATQQRDLLINASYAEQLGNSTEAKLDRNAAQMVSFCMNLIGSGWNPWVIHSAWDSWVQGMEYNWANEQNKKLAVGANEHQAKMNAYAGKQLEALKAKWAAYKGAP